MIDKRIGKRVKQYREKLGYTQEALSEKMKVSPNYISAIERGAVFPRYDNLISLINALEVTANEIFVDVLDKSYEAKSSSLSEEIKELPPEEQRRIYSVVETMISEAKNK